MLLQTNSYIVPREKRAEHAKLLRRFRQTLLRLGCDHFEVYEQMGPNWNTNESSNRFVQIMKFRDRRHQQEVQSAERADPAAQEVVADFCALINLSYQQQQGLFAQGYYTSFMRLGPTQTSLETPQQQDVQATEEPMPETDVTAVSVENVESDDSNAAQFNGSGSGIEDAANETLIDAESRPVSVDEESEMPANEPMENSRHISDAEHAKETSPGNNGHSAEDDE